MFRPSRFLLRMVCSAVLLCGFSGRTNAAAAASPEANGQVAQPAAGDLMTKMREDVLLMIVFFDTTLPGTLSQYTIVLDFLPKFSDAAMPLSCGATKLVPP